MTKDAEERQARLYAEAAGKQALERQKVGAQSIHPCCGWRRANGHHPMCANAPKKVDR